MQYKIQNNSNGHPCATTIIGQNISIPFAPDNTDYAQFKVDLSEGVTLLDAEGVEMTPEQVQEFLETLP
jgi:hypothetical protein